MIKPGHMLLIMKLKRINWLSNGLGVGSERHSSYRTGVGCVEVDAGTKMEGWRSGGKASREEHPSYWYHYLWTTLHFYFKSPFPNFLDSFFPPGFLVWLSHFDRGGGARNQRNYQWGTRQSETKIMKQKPTHNKKENVLKTHTHFRSRNIVWLPYILQIHQCIDYNERMWRTNQWLVSSIVILSLGPLIKQKSKYKNRRDLSIFSDLMGLLWSNLKQFTVE